MNAEPDENAPRPPRRKRYSGKNPRRFAEKYKELDPARYGATVAKVLASGKTPAGSHVPVMVAECMAALRLTPADRGVDCTLGYGGHAAAILQRVAPGGSLLGLDQDAQELPRTEARLRAAGWSAERFTAVRSNFAGIGKAIAAQGWAEVDFIFADLGCSSMQYDDPARGFTYKAGGPLDMRMNPTKGITAREFLRKTTAEKLAGILRDNADEPKAAALSLALAGVDFPATTDLAAAVKHVSGSEADDVTLKRVFQAIRIAVNDEFGALDSLLRVLPTALASGGRAAILTFHSGEDRRVKKAFQSGCRDGTYAEISDAVIAATPEERRANPRSIPAKLRWAVRA